MSLFTLTSPLVVSVFVDQPILAVIYLITLGVAAWVVRDGLRRDLSVLVALGWAIGIVVVPPIAFFGYLYRRSKTEDSTTESPISDPD